MDKTLDYNQLQDTPEALHLLFFSPAGNASQEKMQPPAAKPASYYYPSMI